MTPVSQIMRFTFTELEELAGLVVKVSVDSSFF